MRKLSVILIVLIAHLAYGHYQGPFLLWGVEDLNDMKIPALQAIDDQNLRDIYTKASAIVIYIRNATTKLSYENFPELSDIISKNEWLYLPQELLSSDPLVHSENIEVITLTGSAEMQDRQIIESFTNAQVKFGNSKVLGVLAESKDHLLSKREATSEEPNKSFIFEAEGKSLLFTKQPPILSLKENGTTVKHELKEFTSVTSDQVKDEVKLTVNFIKPGESVQQIIVIRFVFYISAGNWHLTHIEYGDKAMRVNIFGSSVYAPLAFSYACRDSVTFKSENVSLILKGFQVQPILNGAAAFSKAYDCYGFMSAPILSGLFVASILLFVLTIGLTAILDIKTPTRFENRHSKPLTFNVQE